jgi:transposase
VIEGLSMKQIAGEITSSTSTVRKWLLHFDIELRSKSQHHGNPSQLKFGQKRKLGKIEEYQREQRVIKSDTTLKGARVEFEGYCQNLK